MQVTRPSTPNHYSTLPLCSLPIVPLQTYAYPLQLYLAHTSDHHSHRSLHIRLTFSIVVSFALSFLSPSSIHCLVPAPLLNISSPFSTVFSYTASLSITPPYAPSFPFLSFSFPSHSYWLYHYIFILALIIHLFILRLIGSQFVYYPLTIVPSVPSHSYWSIARLSLLYESDSIATPSCIYTYQ